MAARGKEGRKAFQRASFLRLMLSGAADACTAVDSTRPSSNTFWQICRGVISKMCHDGPDFREGLCCFIVNIIELLLPMGIPICVDLCHQLIEHLKKAHFENCLPDKLKVLAKYRMLIIDEIGYLPIGHSGREPVLPAHCQTV